MRLSAKLTLGLASTALMTFGTYAWWSLAQEERELRTVKERECSLLTRSLQVSLENALRDGKLDDVRETINRLELVERAVDVLVFDAADTLRATSSESSPAHEHLEAQREAATSGTLVLRFVPAEAPRSLLAAVPLSGDSGERLGTLVVDRPVDDLRADVDATRRASALAVVVVVTSTALVVLALSRLWIGRPLDRLRDGMRRVRGGDLGTAISPGSRDEIGALAGEFNEMLAELRHARERLAAEAESRRRLQSALQERDKLARVGQLSAGLAHEIGSPLQVLIGRARALDRRADDEAAVRKQAGIIVTQGERITRIVEQLLRFARRPREGAPAVVDAASACYAVVELLELEARAHGVSLSLEAERALPEALVSEDHMQQIVLNLTTNALAATPRGGRVRVSVARVARDPQGNGNDQRGPRPSRLRLVVADTGRGISPTDLPRVFEPFFTTRAEEGGTGLGLVTVRALVLEHRGTIEVASELGVGTTFTVELPARDAGGIRT